MKNFKKKGMFVFILGLGLVIVGAVPYYSGYFIKKKVLEVVDTLNAHTAYKTEVVSYSRGWRHSTVVMKMAISDHMMNVLCPVSPASLDELFKKKTKNYILLQHHFTHGPFVKVHQGDVSKWEAAHAMMDSTILGFEGEGICTAMKDLEQQKTNWSMNGQIALNGDLMTQIDEKAFEYANKEVGFKLKSEGAEIKLKLTDKSKHFEVNALAPALYIEVPKSNTIFTMKELVVNIERNYQEKVWAGESHYTISHMNIVSDELKSINNVIEFNQINMGDVVKLNNQLVDFSASFNVDWLKLGKDQYGPVNLMFSVNKLTPDFYNKILELAAKEEGGIMTNPEKYEEEIKKLLPEVLKHEPELVLDKLFIKTVKGDILLNAKMSLGGEGATDINQMDKIIASIHAMKHAEIDESLFREVAKMYYETIVKTIPAVLWTQAQTTPEQWIPIKVQEMLNKVVSMGFFVQKDNKLMMDLTFEKMQTLMNGKPFKMPSPGMFKAELPQPVPVPAAPAVVEPAPAVVAPPAPGVMPAVVGAPVK